jgi:hypothetical protein
LPRWTEGMDDVIEPYVWPSTEAPPVVAPYTRSWDRQVKSTTCVFVKASSTMFVRKHKPRFRSSRVTFLLLPSRRFSWLVCVHA